MRIVIDANVFASALIQPKSNPGKIVQQVFKRQTLELILSSAISEEIRRVLFYPKIRKYIKESDEEIIAFIKALESIAIFCEPSFTYQVIVTDDPDDDKYVIAALESCAKILISGDKHLLNLKHSENLKIVNPSFFVQQYFKN